MIIKISDYIKGNICTTGELSKVCNELGSGDILCLEGMKLDVYPKGGGKFSSTILANYNREESRDRITAFPIINKKNVTIDGAGADMIFHGIILPFGVNRSENVTIKNLSIDYAEPYFTQADIIEAEYNRVVLKADGKEFFIGVDDEGKICFGKDGASNRSITDSALCLEFRADGRGPAPYATQYFFYTGKPKDHGFLGYMFRDLKAKQLSDNMIELTGNMGFKHTVGNKWVCVHGCRGICSCLATYSKNIVYSNVTLYQSPGFGFFNVICENVKVENSVVDVRAGSNHVVSINADATNFTNCRGKITIKGCRFVRMMDDASNIHGIYLYNVQKSGANSFTAGYARLPFLGANIFQKGDKVSIIDTETTKSVWIGTVKESVLFNNANNICVTTYEQIPEIGDGFVAENLTTAPEVYISDTESGYNRPRGFLLSSSGKTVVENCKFYNINAAIYIGGELIGWYESSPAKDVLIRNNKFENATYCGGYVFDIIPKIKNRELAGYFHGKIVIENNHFRLHEKRFVDASNVAELIFRNNTFTEDKSLPSHPVDEKDGFSIELCGKTEMEDPKLIG